MSASGSVSALPLALTMGEPAGIAPDITIEAWLALRERGLPFFVIGDPEALHARALQLATNIPLATIEAAGEAIGLFQKALPVLPLRLAAPVAVGRPDAGNASAVIASIREAVRLVTEGKAAAVVTNPIQKATLYAAGFAFPGHTEFLEHLAGPPHRVEMMLACPQLRVVPVTIHAPLRSAIDTLSGARIIEAARTTAAALRRDFGIENPRLVVAGLNPHAGEAGTLGREELEVIQPAIDALRGERMDVMGPLPSDTLFTPWQRRRYDAAICMYHDQALIPVKTLDPNGGVNITLGLPFVRTSPDHGTALDIAATGKASAASLISAMETAATMAGRRSKRGDLR